VTSILGVSTRDGRNQRAGDMHQHPDPADEPELAMLTFRPSRSWQEIVAPRARADHRRALGQLLNTAPPFLFLMAALIYGARSHPLLTFPLALPALFLLVRLFAIQHDFGHGSFFASRRANDLLGREIGW
jgi:omega-6 fatty acid desaturase (delta-12 desaturase)